MAFEAVFRSLILLYASVYFTKLLAEQCEDEDALLKQMSGNPMASCAMLKRMGQCEGVYAMCPKTCDVCGKEWDHPHWHEINLTHSFQEVLRQDLLRPPQILSCFYGYAGCIGVPGNELNNKSLRGRGCVVTEDGFNSPSDSSMLSMCSQRHFSVSRTPLPSPLDGMPCVFSFPIDRWSLESVEQIEVRLSDGRVVNPDCATLRPAVELTQLHTLLLLSESFGAKENSSGAVYPVSVRVRGVKPLYSTIDIAASSRGPFDLSYDGNMRYADTGVQMIRARLFPVTLAASLDSVGVSLIDRQLGSSTCAVSFPQSTHSLQVLFNGGMTKDGVTRPALDEASLFYNVKLGTHQLNDEVLGLADATLPVNYDEICLRLSDEQLKAALQSNLTIETPCSGSSALYGPKGLCSEASSACTATRCAPVTLKVEMSLITDKSKPDDVNYTPSMSMIGCIVSFALLLFHADVIAIVSA
eukprot:TRINITY_DN8058_c0_g1_i1.p1 TRINITY_DN8058_c0_g1~~TRINITY_DN8058_c0_g1_i1.p1  ORF type:complete len:470 (+),score=47.77 TRINITY_DN8058_c0_g1_i1:77-1486(+)